MILREMTKNDPLAIEFEGTKQAQKLIGPTLQKKLREKKIGLEEIDEEEDKEPSELDDESEISELYSVSIPSGVSRAN